MDGEKERLGVSPVIGEIAEERRRQIEEERWTPEHDDEHGNAELARAAACYALSASLTGYPNAGFRNRVMGAIESVWPWDRKWWKPKSPRRDLIRAAALLVAEIERLDRQAVHERAARRGMSGEAGPSAPRSRRRGDEV